MNTEIVEKAQSLLAKIQEKFPQFAQQNNDNNIIISHDAEIPKPEYNYPKLEEAKILSNRVTKDILKKYLDSEKEKQLHTSYDEKYEPIILNDIAIIQAFHGTEVSRIQATIRAIEYMLALNPKPKDFVFIESQNNKNKSIFGWLKDYGIKYYFVKTPKESEGLLLKTALWNIGVEKTTAEKLCFIDSDIVFCNQDFLKSVDDAFDEYDVLSLAGHVYYENNEKKPSIANSIGYNVMITNETDFSGHIGFNIGMTRKAYEKYGKFEAFNLHDDTWIWTKILGTDLKPQFGGFMPYKPTDNMKYGLPFKIGSTEECCCHLCHTTRILDRYALFGYISYYGTQKPFEDISYDVQNVNVLPIWANNNVGKTIKLAFEKAKNYDVSKTYDKEMVAKDLLFEAQEEIYGKIDDEHPLIVFCGFVADFKHKDIESIIKHKEFLEQNSKQPFTFICITNEIDIEDAKDRDLNVIPFSSKKVMNDKSLWKNEIYRKDIKLPKNSTRIFVDFDTKDISQYRKI